MTDTMWAWVADGKGGVDFREAASPVPAPDEALIECKATTVARGEVRFLPHMPEGKVLGLDLAGVVIKQAADGSGPPVGTRVIAQTGYSGGGWGQFAALPAATLGAIPGSLSWAEAGVLPNSGLTAWLAVCHGGCLLGARVLVTGATGAVGRIAAQLAKIAGAEVTGTVSRPERVAALAGLELEDIVVANDSEGPFDLIIDNVGGGTLSHAFQVIGPEGVVVTIGGGEGFDAPSEPAIVPHGWFHQHPGARLEAENVGIRVINRLGVADSLRKLAKLAGEKRLDLDIDQQVTWRETPQMIETLKVGKLSGRVAILID